MATGSMATGSMATRAMATVPRRFAAFSRLLHWTMSAMVFAQLFIGVTMVASLADYHVLLSIHRPLGVAILVLVVIRFVNRLLTTLPPYPSTMPPIERLAATTTELAMYGFMFLQPLTGWAMLSAARYPIVLYGSVHLPFILPHNVMVYALLHKAHTAVAYLFFFSILAHVGSSPFSHADHQGWNTNSHGDRGKLDRPRKTATARRSSRITATILAST